MLGLRMAGKALRDFDQAYVDKILSNRNANTPEGQAAFQELTSGIPLADVYKYPNEGQTFIEKAGTEAFTAGVMGANIASRYGLPAGGLTLAGKGMYDIIQNSIGGEQTSGTVMP